MPRVLNLIYLQMQEFGSTASRFLPKAKMSPRHDLIVLREHLANLAVFSEIVVVGITGWIAPLLRRAHPVPTDGLSHGKRNVTRLQCASATQIQGKDVRCHLDA